MHAAMATQTSKQGPLTGVRVLDLSRLLPGPYATQLLVDMGAQVDKLEAPGLGDYLRDMPPYVRKGIGACFHELNRGKRSISLDLKKPKGAALFRRLLSRYDVLVDSFRPGVMRKLGLDLDELCQEFPHLISASILGYPEDGPRAEQAGHDLNFVARSGLMTSGAGLSVPTAQVADVGAALYTATAICSALYARGKGQRGQRIRVAMSEAIRGFGVFGNAAGWHQPEQHEGAVRNAPGLLEGAVAAYNLYETADGGRVAVAALEAKFWALFAGEVGLDPHPRATLPGSHQVELIEVTRKAVASRSTDFWYEFSERVDCCVSVVGEDSERGPAVKMAGASVASFGVTSNDAPQAPLQGESTEAILREAFGADFDEAAFADWREAGLFG